MTEPATEARPLPLHDFHPKPDDMLGEVVAGLESDPKSLPCKYFYDRRGSQLFDRICHLDEYYPTRTEIGILGDHADEIAEQLGAERWVVELGSGSSTKIRILLESLERPAGYVPIDISRDHLLEAAERIARRFPRLDVHPICADFNEPLELPAEIELASRGRRLVFFPGSTIGNFGPESRIRLLRRARALCGAEGGQLLIGIDLVKDVEQLEAAYNDSEGVTAAFNLNLLRRLNAELGADFELDAFEHRAVFDDERGRIEMHLVSTEEQAVRVDGHTFSFESGEAICTEHSYKFTVEGFGESAKRAGWRLQRAWSDDESLFAILLLHSEPAAGSG